MASSSRRVIAGRFQLIRPVESGGPGRLFIAREKKPQRLLALKLIPTPPRVHPRELERFKRAVAAANHLSNPGLVEIYDIGHDPRQRMLWIAMELFHGRHLQSFLNDPKIDTTRRLDLLQELLDPLAAAHEAGLAHLGLGIDAALVSRSANGDEVVKLLDFGVSRVLSQTALSPEGAKIDRAYQPPEFFGDRSHASPAADMWAMGVMLYEIIAGERPFKGLDADLAQAIVNDAHKPLDEVCITADPSMSQLIDLCLTKDLNKRPQDARALQRLMKTLRGGSGSWAFRNLTQTGAPGMDTVIDLNHRTPDLPPEELEEAIRRMPRDPSAHRAQLAHYEQSQNVDGVWCAVAALRFLEECSPAEDRLYHHLRPPECKMADRGIDSLGWRLLLHPGQDHRIDSIWAELSACLVKLHRRPDDELGLKEARKLDLGRPEDELSKEFARAVSALRPGILPRLYRGKAGSPPRHLAAEPAASIFPRSFEEPLPPGSLPLAVGRHVAYYRPAHLVCTLLEEPDVLENAFEAGIRLGLGWKAQSEDQARMTELIKEELSRSQLDKLRRACAKLGKDAKQIDLGSWRRAVELSCCRAGLVLSGDLLGASWMLRWNQEKRRIPAPDAIDDLLAFWSSGSHVQLRRQLGLGVSK